MRSVPARAIPSVALACALAVGSLAACSAGGAAPDGAAPDGAAPDGAAASASAARTSASPVATAPPSAVTVDTTDVATDPPAGEPAGTSSPGDRPSRSSSVTVTTTFAAVLAGTSSVEAGGYVDVVESDGTCTLTLTRGPATRTVTAEGTPDATTTSCGGLVVAVADLEPGTWQAVLGYESSRSSGSASAVDVEVP